MINHSRNAGQTVVALLIFMLLAITLASTAVVIIVANLQSDTAFQNGELALANAQTGVENALIQLERNSSYTGETMTLTTGTATITVSGSSPVTIQSVGSYGSFIRTVTATATITNGAYALTSWSETP